MRWICCGPTSSQAPAEPEVGPVGARRESQHVDVERQRSGDVVHVDRDMVDTEHAHDVTVSRGRPRASCEQGGTT